MISVIKMQKPKYDFLTYDDLCENKSDLCENKCDLRELKVTDPRQPKLPISEPAVEAASRGGNQPCRQPAVAPGRGTIQRNL